MSTSSIKLVLADVDGTLVTREKILTERARSAVARLRQQHILFAITSGRPPRGMEMLIEPLALTTPVAAFNGGMFVRPDLSVIEQHVLSMEIVSPVMEMLAHYQLDVWLYRGTEWLVRDLHAPHVAREEWTVKFAPTLVNNFAGVWDNIVKIVGVSDDLPAVAACETAVQTHFAGDIHTKQSTPERVPLVSAARSQPYYLDVTHPLANKGEVVLALSRMLNVTPGEIATIGDMPNDVLMFQKSALSIAMGQANDDVKRAATFVTSSSEDEGFANAIEKFVLNYSSPSK
ncbi:MAG: HAD family phosphatase [Verrucomicrobia bacterium]|nr:HAD family phosphatase [Verrucomicrobiota bacterium]